MNAKQSMKDDCDLDDAEPAMRLPYSSMPKLSSGTGTPWTKEDEIELRSILSEYPPEPRKR